MFASGVAYLKFAHAACICSCLSEVLVCSFCLLMYWSDLEEKEKKEEKKEEKVELT